MAHQHHRNSRDDKSKSPRKRVEKDSKFDKKRSDEKPKFSDKKFSKPGEKPFAKKGFDKPFRDKDEKPFRKPSFEKDGFKDDKRTSFKDRDDKPFRKSGFGKDQPRDDRRKPFSSSEDRPFKKSSFGKDQPRDDRRKPFSSSEDRPFKKSSFGKDQPRDDRRKPFSSSEDRPFKKSSFGKDQPRDDRRKPFSNSEDRPFKKSGYNNSASKEGGKSYSKDQDAKKPFRKSGFEKNDFNSERSFERRDFRDEKVYVKRGRKEKTDTSRSVSDDGTIRLNRYISNSGICSRRKADELIEAGVISVNGEVISELGFKVDPAKDQVKYNGELLKREKKIYVLLNKPKDYITTTDDPQERRTVMQLVAKASKERIYPVGRLDRNTTGLLLMTNDGDLADKLSHPKHKVTKIYNVELSKNLTQGDFNKISFGLDLEDGFIKPDNVSYVTGGSKKEIGIQIHSGKNRIVRRIFEHLGYDVVKLDRVVYANLTKKDLPRGKWRFLQEHELIQLKHLL